MEDKELAKPGEISSGKLFVKINSLYLCRRFAEGSGERESLALAPIILPGLFEQLLVVFQCLDKLALVAG